MFNFGSLFAGIGGFDLGLERAGMTCKWQVEINSYCLKVLEKHWPNVKRYKDVRDVHGVVAYANWNGLQEQGTKLKTSGDRQFYETSTDTTSGEPREQTESEGREDIGGRNNQDWNGATCQNCLEPVDLICGGFPCQPFSCAGKRKGKEDDRYLWPEMFRIIQELKPRWVLGENVAGIINLELENCFIDLEMAGYEVQALVIPACAVQAPHRRDRVWIVAHSRNSSDRARRGTISKKNEIQGINREALGCGLPSGADCYATDTTSSSNRPQGWLQERPFDSKPTRITQWDESWLEVATRLCGIFNGLSDWIYRSGGLNETEILREMWKVDGTTSLEEWRVGFHLSKATLLLKSLLWRLANGAKQVAHQECIQKAVTKGFSETDEMPGMRWENSFTKTPLELQRCLVCGYSLSEMPHPERIRVGSMGSQSNRVNRLKCLGNAVVPQIVEILGRAILEVETL